MFTANPRTILNPRPEHAIQLSTQFDIKTRTHLANTAELSFFFTGQDQAPEVFCTRGNKSDDGTFQDCRAFDLDPGIAAPARKIAAIMTLGDDSFQSHSANFNKESAPVLAGHPFGQD